MSGIGTAAKTAEELKEELERREQSPEEKVEDLSDPRMQEEWTFPFRYEDHRGRVWEGDFTNRILSNDQTIRVGVIRANLCGNAPVDALDPATYATAEARAHLTESLIKRPKWAQGDKLGKIRDARILMRLYEEVSSHEEIFHGRRQDQAAGEGGEGDSQG